MTASLKGFLSCLQNEYEVSWNRVFRELVATCKRHSAAQGDQKLLCIARMSVLAEHLYHVESGWVVFDVASPEMTNDEARLASSALMMIKSRVVNSNDEPLWMERFFQSASKFK